MFECVLHMSLAVITNSETSKSCSAMKKAIQYMEKSNAHFAVQLKRNIKQKIEFQ